MKGDNVGSKQQVTGMTLAKNKEPNQDPTMVVQSCELTGPAAYFLTAPLQHPLKSELLRKATSHLRRLHCWTVRDRSCRPRTRSKLRTMLWN